MLQAACVLCDSMCAECRGEGGMKGGREGGGREGEREGVRREGGME